MSGGVGCEWRCGLGVEVWVGSGGAACGARGGDCPSGASLGRGH